VCLVVHFAYTGRDNLKLVDQMRSWMHAQTFWANLSNLTTKSQTRTYDIPYTIGELTSSICLPIHCRRQGGLVMTVKLKGWSLRSPRFRSKRSAGHQTPEIQISDHTYLPLSAALHSITHSIVLPHTIFVSRTRQRKAYPGLSSTRPRSPSLCSRFHPPDITSRLCG
jgi:hypothetical protein